MFQQLDASIAQLSVDTSSSTPHSWTSLSICESYARMRNYTVQGSKGEMDTQRAANDILHDALSGVVLLQFQSPAANTTQQTTSTVTQSV